MRREDIANFLNAERRISPLTAFSLLIAAGFFAGSLQLVAPRNETLAVYQQHSEQQGRNMVAAGETSQQPAPQASPSPYQSKAPKNCQEAIQAALNKQKGPEVTDSIGNEQSGTLDKCYGAIVKEGKSPSSKPEDYECVGRGGTVTFYEGRAVATTIPDKKAKPDECAVKVCRVSGETVTCSEPKQMQGGQGVTPKSGAPQAQGGAPSMPQIPSPQGGGGDGGGAQPQTPKPDATKTETPRPTTCAAGDTSPECAITKPVETKPKDPALLEEVKPEERTFTALCADGQPCSNQPKLSPTGAVVPAADGETLGESNANNGNIFDPTPEKDRPQADLQPVTQQTSTFDSETTKDPVTRGVQAQEEKGILAKTGDWLNEKYQGAKETVKGWLGYEPEEKPPVLNPDCAGDPACSSYSKGPQAPLGPCAGDPNCSEIQKTPGVAPAEKPATGPGTVTPAEKPPVEPPAEKPPVVPPQQRPWSEQPDTRQPTTISDPQTAPRPTTGGGLGSLGGTSGLMSFLGGFMKGLGVGQPAASQQTPAQTCPTDPTAYAQYQQDYNYRLQQYNYQLQQYNYQQQNNQAYGYTSSVVAPPPAPTPCRQGLGTGDGQCPQLPATPSPTTCPSGTWRQMTATGAGMVCPVWQCVPNNATTPTAQIACNPDVAEKGSRVTISYTCTNSSRGTGYGFETNGATAGATTVTIQDPPESAAGINYAIKCEQGEITASAQCAVQIAKVSISMRAEPQVVPVGKSALIGYVTTGMKSCVISSPDQSDFTDRNAGVARTSGIATTSAMTEKSDFYLNCITVTGESREEKITVDVYHPGTITASIENRTDVVRGSTATLRWSFPDAPDVSAVALWLYSVEEKKTVALISGHRAKTGTLTWDIPTEDDDCNMSSSIVCGTDLLPGATYAILASLYQPVNANLGEFNDPSLPEPKFIDNPISAAFQVAR